MVLASLPEDRIGANWMTAGFIVAEVDDPAMCLLRGSAV